MNNNKIGRRTYTAAYSARAGRNGIATSDKETAHIVELFIARVNGRGGAVWNSHGETLCGIPAERDREGNLIAAKDVWIEGVRCRSCSFHMKAIGESKQKKSQAVKVEV